MSTVAYTYPGTSALTFNQGNLVLATVTFGDADTTATVTHGFNLTAAQVTAGLPLVTSNQSTAGTLAVNYSVTGATNTVIIAKASTSAGSGYVFTVAIQRPWSGAA